MNHGNALFNSHPQLGQNFSQNGANIPFDPSNFNLNDPTGNFNFPSQLYNQQLQHAVSEANTRHHSPVPQNFPYQTNSIVPAKRPHGLDDVSGASPRPGAGPMGNPRAQTPQSVHGAQYGGQPGMGAFPPGTPFSHMQQQSTPSQGSPPPNMQQQAPRPFQNFPQQQQQHRASPQQQIGGLGTPGNQLQMENGMVRPQPQQQQMPQSLSHMQAMQNNAGQSANVAFNAMANSAAALQGGAQNTGQQRPNVIQDPRRLYQLQLQQQQAALQARNARQASQDQTNAQNAHVPAVKDNNPGRVGAPNAIQNHRASFWQNFRTYCVRNKMPFEQNPNVAGKPIDYFDLFMAANKSGVLQLPQDAPQNNAWAQVARMLGCPPEEYPTAVEDLKRIFERNLLRFTFAWKAQVAKRTEARAQMQQHPQPQQQHPEASAETSLPGSQMSPPADMQRPNSNNQQSAASGHPNQAQYPPTVQQAVPSTQAMQQAVNGAVASAVPGDSANLIKQSYSNQSMQQPASRMYDRVQPSPIKAVPESMDHSSPGRPQSRKKTEQEEAVTDLHWTKPEDEYKAHSVILNELDYGGLSVATMARLGDSLRNVRPTMLTVEDMGAVDLHALALSIQSGIHSEVRNALDQLTSFSYDTRMTVLLDQCPELLDAFVDCAEDQVAILADGLEDASGVDELTSLAALLNEYRLETESVLAVPLFSSTSHRLHVASDCLIAILTIVRNISFYDSLTNHQELVGSNLTSIICQAIRLLMTKRNALQNARNAQDFMKDVVTIFSNIGHKVQLASKDDAFAVLQLLLAFAPQCALNGTRLMFSAYDPRRHQYLPCAVDALAKLLACDDLNRIYFKNIFAADAHSSPPYRLLTKTFAMSISPIPDRSKLLAENSSSDVRLAYHRAPFLSQGMLAADVLASLAPGAESGLAQSWLLSEDCWAPNLMKLVIKLGMAPPSDLRTLGQVTIDRGLSLLQRLLEKSLQQRNRPGQSRSDLAGQLLLPCREQVVFMLLNQGFEKEALKKIVDMAGMDF